MKLTILALCLFVLQVAASITTRGQNFDLQVKNQNLKEVLKEIENKTTYRFFYNDAVLDLNKLVSLNLNNKNIQQVLDELLTNSDASFKILNNNLIVIAPALELQQINVKGTVTDATNGEPLIGVSVKVEGTTNGAITDASGKFSLVVAPNSVISFSFLGYNTELLTVTVETTKLDVKLIPDVKRLEEVVVIGYGTQKKSDLTGAVASVKSDALKNLATSDAAAALQGKAAGVQVLSNSGAPGQGATIRVRGYSSNSDQIGPLLIVDGLKVDNIQYLNPQMIESVEILKDAASAAIYGAAAGNGVVLITTKSGTKGASSISYDLSVSQQRLGKVPKIFQAADFIAYKKMSGYDMDATLKANGYDGTDTNWFDVVFDPGVVQQHTITFQGGNDQGHFFTSLSYLNNDGIVQGNKDVYKRLTAQLNGDYNIKKWLTIGSNNSIEKWETKSVSQMSAYGSVMNSVLTIDPLTPVYYDDPSQFAPSLKQAYDQGKNILKNPANGRYYATSKYVTDDSGNPLLQRDRIDSKNSGISLRGIMFGNLKPVKGLVVTSRFGYRVALSNSHSYNTPYFATSQANSTDYNISATANTSYYYQWENFANYNLTLFGKHNITAMVGMSYQEDISDNVNGTGTGPDILTGYDSNFQYLNYVKSNMVKDPVTGVSTEKTTKTFSNLPSLSTSMAYFGRLIYSYDNRYAIQANFRADAFDASKLSAKNRWGYFPSFSAGWTVSNEKLFSGNVSRNIMSFLKLRGSWGQNGNINVLNGYKYNTTIAYNDSWYQFGVDNPAASYGSHPSGLANPKLKWETSTQTDFAVDMRFLNDRLSFTADYYYKKTEDLLVTIAPTPELGFGSAVVNAGSVLNKGFEFEASWKHKIGDFSYSIGANLATLHNEVTYLDPSIPRLTGGAGGVAGTNNPIYTAFEVGKPIWYFRGYKFLGTDDATGKPIIQDTNKDGTISNGDMTYIGKAIPDYTYGITVNLAYKGFDLNIFGSGVGGNEIFTVLYRADTPMRNSLKYFYDNAWTPSNTGAKMPDPKAVAGDWTFWGSDAAQFRGDYFKIKQIQLGYTVPEKFTKKVLISRLRCYVSLDDYFTITNYPGCDPETATVSTAVDRNGFDAGTYPQSKKVTFGLNITF